MEGVLFFALLSITINAKGVVMSNKTVISLGAGISAFLLTFISRYVYFIPEPLVTIPAICAFVSVFLWVKGSTGSRFGLGVGAGAILLLLSKLVMERLIMAFNPSSPLWSAVGPELTYGLIVTFAAVWVIFMASPKPVKSKSKKRS